MKNSVILLSLLFSLAACASGTSIGNGLIAKDGKKEIETTKPEVTKPVCSDNEELVTEDGREVCRPIEKKEKKK